jgi:hypothetical protein
MASSIQTLKRLGELPAGPEAALIAARRGADQALACIPTLDASTWSRQTALPFWRVAEVVAHLYVVAGFTSFTTALIRRRALDGVLGVWGNRLLIWSHPLTLTALHYSNLYLPLLFTQLLPRDTLIRTVSVALRSLQSQLARVTSVDLDLVFPYFQWQIPIGLYLAAVAKELAVHCWDIEAALDPTARLDAEAVTLIPPLLWRASPLSSKPQRSHSGTICAQLEGGQFAWWLDHGRLYPIEAGKGGAPDAVITGTSERFTLVALDRVPVGCLQLSGDEGLARAFLAAFSYRAGPLPFFNP